MERGTIKSLNLQCTAVREAALDFPSQLINIRFSQANLALMEAGAIKSRNLKLA